MGLFRRIKEPIFMKSDSDAEQQLIALKGLLNNADKNLQKELNEEIRKVESGIFGEQAIHFELANSHIPMFVLHDLYLEHNGLTAQIDYLIITRRHQFVIECKNLYGNIEVNSDGDFNRVVTYGRYRKKEGIYSPITQNRRHLELIKSIRGAEKNNFLTKALFEKYFYDNYRSIVVLANPKTVVNYRYAKKEVREQLIKVDQLSEYIRQVDCDPKSIEVSENDMEELALFFLNSNRKQPTDYTRKFREQFNINSSKNKPANVTPNNVNTTSQLICPKCGAKMVKRKATKGANAGKEFYGCSNFPRCRCIINIEGD